MAKIVYDCIFSTVLFFLGIYIYITSNNFLNKHSYYIKIVCILIFVFSLTNLVVTLFKIIKREFDENSKFKFSKKITIFSLLNVCFALTVDVVGFYAPAIIFIFISSCMLKKQNKIKVLTFSIVLVGSLHVIFSRFLNIEFPEGLIFELLMRS